MLATCLVFVTLGQAAAPAPFNWTIEGLGDPTRLTLVVTVSPTPFGLASGLEVNTISLAPLPTRKHRRPAAIRPLTTEPTATSGLRASFTPPGRRFHVIVPRGCEQA
jgi:hypothetical protein